MKRTYVCIFVYILLVQQSFARTSNSALLVLGGGSQIYGDSHDQSPVLQSFEIFGCLTSSLPDYPIKVFGTNMIWMKRDQEEILMVCGGADWKRAYQKCYSLNPRLDRL